MYRQVLKPRRLFCCGVRHGLSFALGLSTDLLCSAGRAPPCLVLSCCNLTSFWNGYEIKGRVQLPAFKPQQWCYKPGSPSFPGVPVIVPGRPLIPYGQTVILYDHVAHSRVLTEQAGELAGIGHLSHVQLKVGTGSPQNKTDLARSSERGSQLSFVPE